MRSLAQSVSDGSTAGMPLPGILPGLTAMGITPRRGQVTMVAAPPNGGKSLLALWYAIQAKVPTLYISADTDQATTLARAAATLSGRTVDDIEQQLNSDAAPLVEDLVSDADHMAFSYEPSPNMGDIEDEIMAAFEAWGKVDLIIIDNLMNIVGGSGNEWGDLRSTMSSLHELARRTEAGIWVLHHTTESEGDPSRPASRRMIQGKVAQLPEQILTVAAQPQQGRISVACVKNRHGSHDPTGQTHATFPVDFSRMTIYPDAGAAQRARQWASYN